MLTSLFGDLGLAKGHSSKELDSAWQDTKADPTIQRFSASAVLESTDTSVNSRGQMVDRHVKDLFVSGSAAQAMREHFASRSQSDSSRHPITLYDPMGLWAPVVIKALSDASGQPIERLHLRDRATLRTVAMIERTRLARRLDGELKVYHADVRSHEAANAEIPIVLMERADLATVIVGPMEPEALDHLLSRLQVATQRATWACPDLHFLLPPSAQWMAGKIRSLAWPEDLRISLQSESLSSATAVWNAVLAVWDRVAAAPLMPPAPIAVAPRVAAMTADVQAFEFGRNGRERPALVDAGVAPVAAEAPMAIATAPTIDDWPEHESIQALLRSEGLLACAIVDEGGAVVVGNETRALISSEPIDLPRAAAAGTQLLRAHRAAARHMGVADPVDEVMHSAGSRQQLMRRLSRHPSLFLLVVLDRTRTNLALVRYRMLEADKALD